MAPSVKNALCLAIVVALLSSLPAMLLAAEHIVTMVGLSFSPQFLNIDAGDKVTWVNPSTTGHTTTSGIPCAPNGVWDSGLMGQNDTFSYTFNSQGIFPYFCIPHCGLGMVGQITVTGTVPTENKTWGQIKELYRIGGE